MSGNEGPRSFAVFVQEICNGEIEAECAVTLQKLIAVLEDEATSKGGKASGELKLTIKLDVDNKGNCGVQFAVEKKDPKRLRGGGVCWVTKGSNYALEPPAKRKGLREVQPTERMAEPEALPARSV